jgi:hypothetical protein
MVRVFASVRGGRVGVGDGVGAGVGVAVGVAGGSGVGVGEGSVDSSPKQLPSSSCGMFSAWRTLPVTPSGCLYLYWKGTPSILSATISTTSDISSHCSLDLPQA